MATKRQSGDEEGMYFTSRKSVDRILRERALGLQKIDVEPEYDDEITDPPDQDPSSVPTYENVLPQQNSQSHRIRRQPKRRTWLICTTRITTQ